MDIIRQIFDVVFSTAYVLNNTAYVILNTLLNGIEYHIAPAQT